MRENLIKLLEKIARKDDDWVQARGRIISLIQENCDAAKIIDYLKGKGELEGAISNVLTTLSLSRWHF
jgi:hypothetical protein